MSALEDLILRTQELRLHPESPASKVLDAALDAVLLLEGPPCQPIPNYSEEIRSEIARSPKGRPLFMAHTWQTGPWRCLLLDLAPLPMGRPISIKDPNTGIFRVATDYPSQKLQHRIGAACRALQAPPPPDKARLALGFDAHRTFIAWTPEITQTPELRGDIDNYAKNVMDALQRARVIPNDRSVTTLVASKTFIPEAPKPLESHLLDRVQALLAKTPEASSKTIAAALQLSVRHAQRILKALRDAQKPAQQAPKPSLSTSKASNSPKARKPAQKPATAPAKASKPSPPADFHPDLEEATPPQIPSLKA